MCSVLSTVLKCLFMVTYYNIHQKVSRNSKGSKFIHHILHHSLSPIAILADLSSNLALFKSWSLSPRIWHFTKKDWVSYKILVVKRVTLTCFSHLAFLMVPQHLQHPSSTTPPIDITPSRLKLMRRGPDRKSEFLRALKDEGTGELTTSSSPGTSGEVGSRTSQWLMR